jgi:hypothetical protein
MKEIPISADFLPLIVSGRKLSTIRSGIRNYERGTAMLRSPAGHVVVNITAVHHKRFSLLQEEDALRDGFSSIADLRTALRSFYPSIVDDDLVTIVEFVQQR